MENIDYNQYKPIEFFIKKKNKESENPLSSEDVLHQWKELDDKKKLKFIKKAEKKYDEDHESVEISEKNCFAKILSTTELKILIDSYEYPKPIPETLTAYFVEKSKDKGIDISKPSEKLRKSKDRNIIFNEYYELKENYYKLYALFLDSLPPNRFFDYRYYINPFNKTPTPHVSSIKRKKKNEILHPYEHFFNKFEEKFMDNENYAYTAKIKSRAEYKLLDDNQKLKYIKKCEEDYDDLNDKSQPLSHYLNKQELQILFESYGLPNSVPNSAQAYFMKLHYQDIDGPSHDRFRYCIDRYKNLNEIQKDDFIEKHKQDLNEYNKKLEIFKSKLPSSRLEDYNKFSKSTKSKQQNVDLKSKSIIDTSSNLDTDIDDNISVNNFDATNGKSPVKKLRKE